MWLKQVLAHLPPRSRASSAGQGLPLLRLHARCIAPRLLHPWLRGLLVFVPLRGIRKSRSPAGEVGPSAVCRPRAGYDEVRRVFDYLRKVGLKIGTLVSRLRLQKF